MIRLSLYIMIIGCMIVGTPVLSNAKKYTSNGYEVEVNWKVKSKELRIWGDVEKGRGCDQLNVYVQLSNKEYGYSRSIKTYIRKEHFSTGRSVFSGQAKIRDNRHKKWWFVSELFVRCSSAVAID
ncbi:hypothetical protein [Desulfosediminicola flagellatus]|uniref:hypothetical protein n=1 Tax=Desulfosediminicola flagellatus TaxID=2569541 RepID=UPI0010AC152F|nr:hypothetical protein [Desulfosediminicola flagellatus]